MSLHEYIDVYHEKKDQVESMSVNEYVSCSQGNRTTLKYTIIQNIKKTNIMISMPLKPSNLESMVFMCMYR